MILIFIGSRASPAKSVESLKQGGDQDEGKASPVASVKCKLKGSLMIYKLRISFKLNLSVK